MLCCDFDLKAVRWQLGVGETALWIHYDRPKRFFLSAVQGFRAAITGQQIGSQSFHCIRDAACAIDQVWISISLTLDFGIGFLGTVTVSTPCLNLALIPS